MTTTMAQPGLAPDINILEAMDIFKNFPDEELPRYRNDPKLALVAAAEMDRRLRVRKDFETRQQQPRGPVIDQLQQQLLAPTGIAQGMTPQGMAPPQAMQPEAPPQQMPQQAGLGAIGMASGGPVAFFAGGVGPEFGGSEISAAEDEERRQRLLRERKLEEDRNRYQFLLQAGATEQAQRLAQQNPEATKAAAAPTAPVKATTQPGQDAKSTDDLIKAILANRQQTPAPAEEKPRSLVDLAKAAKDYIPEIVPVMSPEDKAKVEEAEFQRMKQRFPDTVSPIMEQLAKQAGTQISPEEARRRAFFKAGVAGLGYTGRDFGPGLAGMLEGYQGTKEGIESANKEAKMLELKARLSNEQYKDALKRKDYESARKYAEETATYQQQAVAARNQYKAGALGIMSAVDELTRPRKAAGVKPGEKAIKSETLIRAQEKILEAAQPEIDALKSEFKKRSEQWFGDKIPRNWEKGTEDDAVKARKEFAQREKAIIEKHQNRVFSVLSLGNPDINLSRADIQALMSSKK